MQKMQHTKNNHYISMFFIMILSGLLSTMNVWVDKLDDIRFSINDAYMVLLMTGWMFLFMGLFYKEAKRTKHRRQTCANCPRQPIYSLIYPEAR